MRKNYVGKPFTRRAKEQEEDAKRIILDDLKDAIEDLKIEYPNQRGYLESVLREGELIASKIVRAERKTVNEIIENRERGLNLLNDNMLKLNINGYSFNNEDKFKEEIIWHIAFNDTRSDFIKYPMREIAIKYFYMPVLKDEARRRGIMYKPSKKNSIGGTQYRSKDRNSRAEVYPGGQDEYGRDLFRVELREDNGHVEELYMTKTKLNRWLDQFGFYPDIYDRFKDDFDEKDIDY